MHNWFYDSLCQSATRNPSGDKCTFYWDIQINSEILVVISIVRSSTWHIFKLVTRLCTSAFLFKSLYEFRLRRRQYARCATEPPSRSGAGLNTINQHAQWTKKCLVTRVKLEVKSRKCSKTPLRFGLNATFFSTFFNTMPCTIVLQNRHENDFVSQFRSERQPVKLYWTVDTYKHFEDASQRYLHVRHPIPSTRGRCVRINGSDASQQIPRRNHANYPTESTIDGKIDCIQK